MSSIAIMQPYFFPYIGYYQLVNAVDEFVFYDDVNYIKQGWVHRNRILINEEPKYFGPQLIKPSQNKKINETKLSLDNTWKEKLLKTVTLSYKKAPYFTDVYPIIESVVNADSTTTVSELAILSITEVSKYLGIQTRFHTSSQKYTDNILLRKQHRLIDICNTMGISTYINAIGGKEIYTKEEFAKYGVNLSFIKMNEIEYKNSHLSIVDLIMNVSKETMQDFIGSYSII